MYHCGDLVWIKSKKDNCYEGWGLVVCVQKTVLMDKSIMIDLVVFGNGQRLLLPPSQVKKFSFMNSHIGVRESFYDND